MPKFINLQERKIGNLLVISQAPSKINNKGNKIIYWNCKCSCGNLLIVSSSALNNKKRPTKSCGCLQKEAVKRTGFKNRQTPGLAGMNDLFRRYKRGAKQRNLEFNLSIESFNKLIDGNCYYCGSEPKSLWKRENEYTKRIYNGIDRKDNKNGYVIENVVTCCKICNKAKMDMSFDDFLEMVKRIYERQFK